MYSQFSKELINNFYCLLVTNNFDNSLENILCEWVKNSVKEKSKNIKDFFQFMQNHENKI